MMVSGLLISCTTRRESSRCSWRTLAMRRSISPRSLAAASSAVAACPPKDCKKRSFFFRSVSRHAATPPTNTPRLLLLVAIGTHTRQSAPSARRSWSSAMPNCCRSGPKNATFRSKAACEMPPPLVRLMVKSAKRCRCSPTDMPTKAAPLPLTKKSRVSSRLNMMRAFCRMTSSSCASFFWRANDCVNSALSAMLRISSVSRCWLGSTAGAGGV